MYPFNRTTSIHAENAMPNIEEMDEEDENRQSNGKMYTNRHTLMDSDGGGVHQAPPPGEPVEKTILASILEMSSINDKWAKRFATPANATNKKEKKRRESLFECSWR